MQEYKGYGGGKVVIDGNNILIKQMFTKENCTFDNIRSVEFVEPTFTKNGSLQITTQKQIHIIFFLSSKRELFWELYEIFKKHLPESDIFSEFESTKVIGDFMEIDDNHKLVRFKTGMIQITKKYNEILDFELIENDETIVKGGAGKALVGGLLFGTTGAIIGSSGNKKASAIVQKVEIIVRLRDMNYPTISYSIINTPTKKTSTLYSLNMRIAQDIISSLEIITKNYKNQNTISTESSNSFSVADEILKFKQLLDSGIITKEEFDDKKKQLLGL